MFDWVIYRLPKILSFQSEAKLEQVIAIIITHSVFLLNLEKAMPLNLLISKYSIFFG